MKVCSLYGAGFYYIPGTDTCIKLGGFMRVDYGHNTLGSHAVYTTGAQALYDRNTDTHTMRTRAAISADVRTQTEYGTLRSYIRGGWQWTTNDAITSNNNVTYYDRGFIQFAGFTFGKTESFFDFYPTPVYSFQTSFLEGSSGGVGQTVLAYTAQFGNGVSATLSLEDNAFRQRGVFQYAALTPVVGLTQPGGNVTAGSDMYDIVANIRVDQAWGSAQIMGALHEVRASYYGPLTASGHPSDEWGWAAGAGITLKMPWNARDTLSLQGVYCEGASAYCFGLGGNAAGALPAGAAFGWFRQPSFGVGYVADGYLGGAGTGIDLARSYSLAAAFQHYWTPSLRQSIYGQYANYESNSAVFDANVCAATPAAGGGFLGAGCADWSAYQIGSRILWNPVANLDIGLDVIYTHLDTAFGGAAPITAGGRTASFGDGDVWSAQFRVQRNFWP